MREGAEHAPATRRTGAERAAGTGRAGRSGRASRAGRAGLAGNLLVAVAIAAALALWWTSLALIDPDALDDFGLIAILPWPWWAALVLVASCFVYGLTPSADRLWVRVSALLALIVLLHATPPIVYGTLRYSWAWKHIGIVDYILRHGGVNRTEDFLAAYHNWPGFFWISAKIAEVFRMDALDIADAVRFVPVFSNIAFAALLWAIYRRFTDNETVIWAALWIYICANWVGQDYYAPQALAYALHLLVLALCLGPLMPATRPGPRRMFRPETWFAPLRARTRPAPTWLRILAVLAVSLAILGIVVSHQLTPLVLVLSLLLLALFTPLSLGYPLLAILALIFWVIYPAAPFTALYLPGEVASLGQTMDGVTDKMVNTGQVDLGVAVVVWAGRALSGAVVLLGILGWWRLWRRGRPTAIICALLIAPGLVLGVTSYGGEAVFRIYFFCLPFLAFFAGSAFFAQAWGKGSAIMRPVFLVAGLLMAVGFLFGNNGKDRQYRFSTDEVAAAEWMYARGAPGALLVEGARSYPSQFMYYENFTYVPISNERPAARQKILDDPAGELSRWFSDPDWKDGYVIITRSQKAYVEALGIAPLGAYDRLERDLLASPDFRLVFANRDARVFRAQRFVAAEASQGG